MKYYPVIWDYNKPFCQDPYQSTSYPLLKESPLSLKLTVRPWKNCLNAPKRKRSYSKHPFFRCYNVSFRAGTLLKTNMTLENPNLTVGNISSNDGFSIIMLVEQPVKSHCFPRMDAVLAGEANLIIEVPGWFSSTFGGFSLSGLRNASISKGGKAPEFSRLGVSPRLHDASEKNELFIFRARAPEKKHWKRNPLLVGLGYPRIYRFKIDFYRFCMFKGTSFLLWSVYLRILKECYQKHSFKTKVFEFKVWTTSLKLIPSLKLTARTWT